MLHPKAAKPPSTLPPLPFEGLEPDVVDLFCRQIIAMAPELEAAILAKKDEFCQEMGGQRYYLPKGGTKRLTPEQRQAVYTDGLTNMPEDQIIKKHKIHRATLFRVMKTGGGRFG